MNATDQSLIEKFEAAIVDGLDESNAISFFAKLAPSEYDQLITAFSKENDPNMPETIRLAMRDLFTKLKAAKQAAT